VGNPESIQDLRLLTDDEQLQKIQLAMEFEEVSRNEEIAGGRDPGYNGSKMVTKTPSTSTE